MAAAAPAQHLATSQVGDILADVVPTSAPRLPTTNYMPTQVARSGRDSEKDTNRAVIIAVAIILILIMVYWAMMPQDMGDKLAARGWILYIRDGCSFCERQLTVLGGSYPKIVECTAAGKLVRSGCGNPPFACHRVSAFPHWWCSETKETRTGLQTLSQLQSMMV